MSFRNLILLALTLATVLASRAVWGQPAPASVPLSTGVQITAGLMPIEGPGYCPLLVKIQSPAAQPADRTFSIEVVADSLRRAGPDLLKVTDRIELPAGQTEVSKFVSVPQFSTVNQFVVQVAEDGLQALPFQVTSGGGATQWLEDTSHILFVGDQPVDLGRLAGVTAAFPRHPYAQQQNVQAQHLSSVARVPGDLSENWLDYTALDVVCISLADMEWLQQNRPHAWQAIRAWTHAGGNLWIHGLDQAKPEWSAIETALGLAIETQNDSPSARGWQTPLDENYSSELNDQSGAGQPNELGQLSAPATPPATKSKTPAPPAHFAFRKLGFGFVVALYGDPFAGTTADWGWVFTTMNANRYLWPHRFGLSTEQENDDFWNFLIPGVGLAPVNGFRVLITLFVFVIGPTNYYLLRKWRRLHLLLFTTPATAAVVTLGLVLYALIADGLDTRVRARSITHLDQRWEQSATWSRLSYYAGRAPAGGLHMPLDTAVIPYEETPQVGYFDQPVMRGVEWGVEQSLSQSWLKARTPTQFITVNVRPNSRQIKLHAGSAGAGPQIENRLDAYVTKLMLRDRDGKLYYAVDLAPGGTATPRQVAPVTISSSGGPEFTELLNAFSDQLNLQAPFTPGDRNALFGLGGRRYRYYMRSQVNAQQSTNRLEQGLRDVVQQLQSVEGIPRRSYVALVEDSPEVMFGLDDVREEDSFHVIVGSW